jgi:hypothetical protein
MPSRIEEKSERTQWCVRISDILFATPIALVRHVGQSPMAI